MGRFYVEMEFAMEENLVRMGKGATLTVGNRLECRSVAKGGLDRVVWADEEGGVFSLKSTYRALITSVPSERC